MMISYGGDAAPRTDQATHSVKPSAAHFVSRAGPVGLAKPGSLYGLRGVNHFSNKTEKA